jgi:polyketide-type polyunsaturated fatty acid synthase PfaA
MKNFKLGDTPIAVVGMASLMPDAKDLNTYWDNIVEKMVSIVDVPADRWSIEDYYDADPFVADKTYCKRGAFIPDIEFNPMEYGLPPNILEVTDVSQLLGLVVAKDVLADSGILSENDYDHDRIGITLGIGGGQKLSAALTARLQYPVIDKVLKGAGVPDADRAVIVEKYKKSFVPWEENSFPGLLGNVIAGRIANRFNFGGMNSVVDAACASSLSAIKMAVNELILGHSDLMITGGSCTDNSIFMYMSFSKTPAFTNTDFIQPFDIDSKGMMVGEGIGMIALKRLEDAERDGDRIYALVKGIGASSDGRFKSIYAPRSEGQAKALNRAYDQAGFDAKTVGLIEAHGTGTAAGDVAEFNSLNMVFGKDNDKKQHIALGSVKSQIGHLKAAAGAAGFIKCALALHHKVLPPTASLNTPNPKLEVEKSPFYLNAETRPWLPSEDGSPRRAAVSAFGFGGTNFHFVLEEYQKELTGAVRLKNVDSVSVLDAEDEQALIVKCNELIATLNEQDAENKNPVIYQSFIDETTLKKLPAKNVRVGFVSKDADSALNALTLVVETLKSKSGEQAWELPQGISYRNSGMDTNGKVVALFPGQGSQYLRMGDVLAQNYPEFRSGIAKLDELFVKEGASRLSDVIYPIAAFTKEDKKSQEAALQLTQHAQPSIGAFSVGAYKLFTQAGFKADFVAGHSFGELTALWAAGVYSEDDFYSLAKARGAAMAAPDDKDFDAGTMMAVSGDIVALEKALKKYPEITIANFNSNAQVVIAGAKSALEFAQDSLKEQGFKLIPLPVSAAFHTPLVAHAQKPFAKHIDNVKFNKPSVPVYANGTGKVHEATGTKIKAALKDHILNSVQFKDEIENIYKDGGRIFVEFGPKNVLAKLTSNILEGKDATTLSVNPAAGKSADTQLKLLAAKLAVLGVNLNNIDPYAAPKLQHNTQKPSPLNIKISAAAYVSDKTRNAFTECLDDGFKLTNSVSAASVPVQESAHQTTQQADQQATNESRPVNTTSAVNSEINLDSFYALQNETLRVHEKYLENPAQYVESFQTLLSQIATIMQERPDFQLPKSIERSLIMFNEQQTETIKVHETFLNQQAQASQASLNLMTEHYSLLTGGNSSASSFSAKTSSSLSNEAVSSPSALTTQNSQAVQNTDAPVARTETPAPATSKLEPAAVQAAPQVAAFDVKALTSEMLKVVAEKTGYPTEMLELDMDMEADLGIDSIKRVEILGSIQEAYPELPELDPEALSELRTLQQIVDYIETQMPAGGVAILSLTVAEPASSSAQVVAFDVAALTNEMLKVVAEKTGYPTEMLELDMDMEADLGIDSIKRVEILGSIQESYPELPELDPEALSELRTLKQIVDYIEAQMPEAGVAVAAPVNASQVAVSATSTEPVPVDMEGLKVAMLEVVAEKTGYPTEMLELDMDMEADLGIDSIKRVEILGSIQESYPELPELDPEALSELRTLAQIINYMREQLENSAPSSAVDSVQAASSAAPQVLVASSSIDVAELTQGMLEVVADKTGYPIEMLEMDMDMEADLGIDSIKRVEILGTVTENFPELPELNPEALAELRTLAEIVDYMKAQVTSESVSSLPSSSPVNVSPSVDLSQLQDLMMNVVAEKTGYPTEMLELDMDMEADLGIDSIKRVEILGSIQEQVPGLPEFDPEVMSELRTLGEIVNYMKEAAQETSKSSAGSAQQSAELVSMDEYKQSHNKEAVQGELLLKPARAVVIVKKLSKPDALVVEIDKERSCLIVNDGTSLSTESIKTYQNEGWKVALLSFEGIALDDSLNKIKDLSVYSLTSFEEDELTSVLEKIEQEVGKVANFVYLDNTYSAQGKKANGMQGLAFSEIGKLHLRHLFLLAKHLKNSLNTENDSNNSRNAFVAVTHLDGELGYAGPDSKSKYDALSGGVFGLVKTLKQEWPEVFCRAIDLEPSIKGKAAAELILAENSDANMSIVEVGIGKEGRCTLIADEMHKVPKQGEVNEHQINKDSVFVVSGGAKGVTSKCVIALAKVHQCAFILLGRSALNDTEPTWAKNCADESALKLAAMAELKAKGDKPTPVTVQKFINPVLSEREIKYVLKEIEAAGSKVSYLACNVFDQKSLKKALKTAESDLGTITGVVHGAGVLADKLIENKTVEDFESVYNTKIGGLASLLSCVDMKSLKHLVLFSSAAGFFGNPAQADYAMANDILNKVAMIVQSQNKDCRVLSFNWGPWDGGMVTPQLKKLFEARGVELISLEGGAKLFCDYLSAKKGKHAQVLVGSSMEASVSDDSFEKKSLRSEDLKFKEKYLLKRKMKLSENGFLQAHKIHDQAVLPIVCSAAWHVQGAMSCFPEFYFLELQDVQVFKGLVFDESKKDDELVYFQELAAPQYHALSNKLVMRSIIFSENNKKRINHYGANIVLSSVKPSQDVEEVEVELDVQKVSKAEASKLYKDGTLFHGKDLQLLKKVISNNEQEILIQAKSSDFKASEQGNFFEQEFSHFSMDALLQACLVWVKINKDMASLPLKIGRLQNFKKLDSDDDFFIRLTVKDLSASKMTCNINCFDDDGDLLASMSGAEVTMSKQLTQKFAS